MIKLKESQYGLVIDVPWNERFLDEFKQAVPYSKRVWNTDKKGPARFPNGPMNVWIVDWTVQDNVVRLIEKHYREEVQLPLSNKPSAGPVISRGVAKVIYVGRSRARDDNTHSASGLDFVSYMQGNKKDWRYIFPLNVLKNYWDNTPLDVDAGAPAKAPTLFGILGLPKPTEDLAVIKSAYRQQCKQWHPDYCKEPDAAERFHRVQQAYEKLNTSENVQRYVILLKLAENTPVYVQPKKRFIKLEDEYSAPMRCGVIDMSYTSSLGGRVLVKQIHDWKDITDNLGRTLTVSWAYDKDNPIDYVWVAE